MDREFLSNPKPPLPADGAHIASGQYRNRVVDLTLKYPNLKHHNLPYPPYNRPVHASVGKVAVLDFRSQQTPSRSDFIDAASLRAYLSRNGQGTTMNKARRLFLVEGWDVNIIDVMGNFFDINPATLQRQQRSLIWEVHHSGGNTPPLPTTFDSAQTFTINYYEPRWFTAQEGLPPSTTWRCAEGYRYIGRSRTTGDIDKVGVVHRKATYWSKRGPTGSWDAVLFLDPQVHDVFIGPRLQARQFSVRSEPYQGGYVDFMQYSSLQEACTTPGPSRLSILEDICYYWLHHGTTIQIGDEPAVATIFLKKIVASNYVLCIEYIRSVVNELAFAISRRDAKISEVNSEWAEDRWANLQEWSLHCSLYCESIEDIFNSLQLPFPNEKASSDWMSCEKDFQVIYRGLREMKGRLGGLVSSFTGLIGILGNRHALQEAKRIKILTLLGMTFLPLSFTAGVFSMGSRYLPGSSHFWVFLVIALPLVLIVFGLVFFLPSIPTTNSYR